MVGDHPGLAGPWGGHVRLRRRRRVQGEVWWRGRADGALLPVPLAGPRGGDEINLLRPGRNYGWPVITFGLDYSGARISPYQQMPGMEQPLHSWVPSIAPSGLAVYRGDVFPEWQGDLFVGALVDREARRVRLRDDRVVEEEALFGELGERLRDIRVGPEGHLYLVTDEGRVLRVERP